jgi:uncharacterized protein YjbI with pentapeptide repeats
VPSCRAASGVACDLNRASFRNAVIEQANFTGAHLEGANFSTDEFNTNRQEYVETTALRHINPAILNGARTIFIAL